MTWVKAKNVGVISRLQEAEEHPDDKPSCAADGLREYGVDWRQHLRKLAG